MPLPSTQCIAAITLVLCLRPFKSQGLHSLNFCPLTFGPRRLKRREGLVGSVSVHTSHWLGASATNRGVNIGNTSGSSSRSSGEVGLCDGRLNDRVPLDNGLSVGGRGTGGRGFVLGLANNLLSLGRVLADGRLDGLAGTSGVLSSQVPDLACLLSDDGASVVQLLINEPLVLDIDEGSEEDDGGGDEGNAPGWNNLDEKVADQGGGEGL